ncbi:hypothetical protein MRX96_028521 [Rhipicephalus microplus]
MCYLVVTIDNRLSWRPVVNNLRTSNRKVLGAARSLIARGRGCTPCPCPGSLQRNRISTRDLHGSNGFVKRLPASCLGRELSQRRAGVLQTCPHLPGGPHARRSG